MDADSGGELASAQAATLSRGTGREVARTLYNPTADREKAERGVTLPGYASVTDFEPACVSR